MTDMRERIIGAIDGSLLRQYDANQKWDEAKDVIEGLDEPAMADAILAEIANPSREFTDAFLNAWVIGGFPAHTSEIHNEHLRKQFREAMAKAVEAINRREAS